MKNLYLCLLSLLLTSCVATQYPPPPELSSSRFDPQIAQSCKQRYVQGKWQFVHSITFTMANGQGATVLGVTVIDAQNIQTGLMGVEGFVLFEATLDSKKNIEVKKALPPFDNSAFALGLMRDVQAIFLLPSEANPVTEQLGNGEMLCRYSAENAKISDLILELGGGSRLNLYDGSLERVKSITASNYKTIDTTQIPGNIQLTAHGVRGYVLDMKLISADKIIQK